MASAAEAASAEAWEAVVPAVAEAASKVAVASVVAVIFRVEAAVAAVWAAGAALQQSMTLPILPDSAAVSHLSRDVVQLVRLFHQSQLVINIATSR